MKFDIKRFFSTTTAISVSKIIFWSPQIVDVSRKTDENLKVGITLSKKILMSNILFFIILAGLSSEAHLVMIFFDFFAPKYHTMKVFNVKFNFITNIWRRITILFFKKGVLKKIKNLNFYGSGFFSANLLITIQINLEMAILAYWYQKG